MSNGKGSRARPVSVEPDEYERRWQATFGTMVDKPGTTPKIVSHEPDPSGGRNSVT